MFNNNVHYNRNKLHYYYKNLLRAPFFSIELSDDPYIDFYVKCCGELIFSKARTQIWDYRFIPGDELNYIHLLIGYLVDSEWHFAEGFEDKVETELVNEQGKYLNGLAVSMKVNTTLKAKLMLRYS